MITVTKPHLFDSFSCIADSCTENCCRDWEIYVERDTYEKYRALPDKEWRRQLLRYVRKVPRRFAAHGEYARLTLNEKKKCAFLNPEGLCRIYLELGPEYQCDTCSRYPRYMTCMNDGYYDWALVPSCPQVIRHIFFSKESIRFERTEYAEPLAADCYLNGTKRLSDASLLSNAMHIRAACIQLIQNRHIPIAIRIRCVAHYLKQITLLWKRGKPEEIPGYTARYLDGAHSRKLARDYHECAQDEDIALILYRDLAWYIINYRSNIPAIQEFIRVFMARSGASESDVKNAGHDVCVQAGKLLRERCLERFPDIRAEYSHVFENYLVNGMVIGMFPFCNFSAGLDPLQNLYHLVLPYALLRSLCCFGGAGETVDDTLVSVIKWISMNETHCDYMSDFVSDMVKRGLGTDYHASLLLREA